jgi:hypothetical protein
VNTIKKLIATFRYMREFSKIRIDELPRPRRCPI